MTHKAQSDDATDEVKQVIVVRKDLNMRKGKIAAQAAHASLKVILDKGSNIVRDTLTISVDDDMKAWILGRFKKVVVYVSSKDDLIAVYNAAKEAGLNTSLILDAGLTEFGGIPTHTTVAVGPNKASLVDKITGTLPLL